MGCPGLNSSWFIYRCMAILPFPVSWPCATFFFEAPAKTLPEQTAALKKQGGKFLAKDSMSSLSVSTHNAP